MNFPSALAATPAVEGAFVVGAYNVMRTVPPVVGGAWRGGPGGTAMGRFGWGATDGRVFNARTHPDDTLGIVLPQLGPAVDWRVVFYDSVSNTYRIREGLALTFLQAGNAWMKFPGGANPGSPVYANVLDGSAIAGYSPDGELTRWAVSSYAQPGGLAIVTTWRENAS